MIPTVPLAVAFALAAILSPTDPIAVSAITSRAPIPKRLMHILEGESLLNDASGLVCMRFALAAALTGTFSFSAAIPTFIWVAGGGIAVGAAFTWAITAATNAFAKRFGQETGAEILVSILIPFGAYLVAEQLHCSGILAAVAAGVSMSYVELTGKARGETRMQRAAVWNTAQFAAKGAIFVLLGEQLPAALLNAATAANQAGHDQVWLLGLYVVAITASLTGLRFLWVWASLQFTLYQAGRRGQQPQAPSWRLIAAMSLAGVRGAITLAGVLTFPLAMRDGSPFPARELVVLLAAGSIILSLIVASVGLPRLLVDLRLPPEDTYEEEAEEERLRAAAAEAAIRAVETAPHRMADGRTDADLYAAAAAELMEQYRTRGGTDRPQECDGRFRPAGQHPQAIAAGGAEGRARGDFPAGPQSRYRRSGRAQAGARTGSAGGPAGPLTNHAPHRIRLRYNHPT